MFEAQSIDRASRPWVVARSLVALAVTGLAVLPVVAQPSVSFVDASASLPTFSHSGVPIGDGLGGAAWFDCNNDRRLDLFLSNGVGGNNALFLNTIAGFVDISASAGIQNDRQGNGGVVAADIDNDGYQDLFLTGDGGFSGAGDTPLALFHNLGVADSCQFSDITVSSGLAAAAPISHMSAAFGDVDNDGYLDLFVAASGSFCLLGGSGCTPGNHQSKLYRNTSAGSATPTFVDITAAAFGSAGANGACSAFFGHFDNDRWIDLVVGNCNKLNPGPIAWPIELFHNQGPGAGGIPTFVDVAATSGIGVPSGLFMGLAPADFNNDLRTDVFATNTGTALPAYQAALFLKLGTQLCPTPPPTYLDVAPAVVVPNQEFGWGATAQDWDNDGFADLFWAGALPTFTLPAGPVIGPGPGGGNPGTLLFNQLPGAVVFADFSASLPPSINLANKFSSGVAAADYDNDGDVDIVIQTDTFNPIGPSVGGAPVLLENQGHPTNSWLRVRLRGAAPGAGSNRDGIGARIAVRDATRTQLREVHAGSSFMSMDSQWQSFGLGASTATSLLAVWWPTGVIETYPNVAANQTVTLVEGAGTVVPLICP